MTLVCHICCVSTGVYIPPGLPVRTLHDFHQHITNIFDCLLTDSPNANLYVCGDFNQYDFSFLDQCFDLCNIVDFPTFGNNTLDKFFCGEDVRVQFSAFSAPPLGNAIHLHKIVIVSRNFQCSSKLVYCTKFLIYGSPTKRNSRILY